MRHRAIDVGKFLEAVSALYTMAGWGLSQRTLHTCEACLQCYTCVFFVLFRYIRCISILTSVVLPNDPDGDSGTVLTMTMMTCTHTSQLSRIPPELYHVYYNLHGLFTDCTKDASEHLNGHVPEGIAAKMVEQYV